jgi:hypothetical protein
MLPKMIHRRVTSEISPWWYWMSVIHSLALGVHPRIIVRREMKIIVPNGRRQRRMKGSRWTRGNPGVYWIKVLPGKRPFGTLHARNLDMAMLLRQLMGVYVQWINFSLSLHASTPSLAMLR